MTSSNGHLTPRRGKGMENDVEKRYFSITEMVFVLVYVLLVFKSLNIFLFIFILALDILVQFK